MDKLLEKEFKNYSILREDIREVNELYDIYKGDQGWSIDDVEYLPVRKITNYIKKLIKEEARFIFGKQPIFEVLNKQGEVIEPLQKLLDTALKENLFNSKLIKGARDCFIGKRIAIKVTLVDKKPIITFVPATNFVFETMENSCNKLKKVVFFQKMCTSTIGEVKFWVQKYEMINSKCYLNEVITNSNGDIVEVIQDNVNTGFDELPCHIIINDGLSHDFIGESDVKEILDNALMYNRIASEDLDTLRKGMNRIIYATDVDEEASKHFSLKPGAFWDVATDKTVDGKQATIGTVNTDFGYDSRMENALSRIKADMHEVLNIPQIGLEELKGMMASGKSMKAIYWQLITRCEEKLTVWIPALEWLCKFILSTLTTEKDFDVVANNQYPLQENEDDAKILDMQQVNTQTMSKKTYMMKWLGYKEEKANDELVQMQFEKQLLDDSIGQFETDIEE